MKDNSKLLNFTKGLWKENPILVTMLGLCPTLAITYKVENALGMGLAVLFVLVMSNLIISLDPAHRPRRDPHPYLHRCDRDVRQYRRDGDGGVRSRFV